MTDQRDDLRATEQAIHHDAETIASLEVKKAALDPTDPDVRQLSDRVKTVAASLVHKATAENELVEQIQAPGKRRRRN